MQNTQNKQDLVFIGKTNFRGQDKIFGVKNKDRFQHMYVLGQTGTGKTTLLRNLAIQDIESGRGLAVVDPHGEFVQSLLETVPENRVKDVIYFNPIDTDFPIGFNILEIKDPDLKHLVSSGLMSIFTKIWANVWSARMEYILNNTVLALLDTPNTTLLGIFLIIQYSHFWIRPIQHSWVFRACLWIKSIASRSLIIAKTP